MYSVQQMKVANLQRRMKLTEPIGRRVIASSYLAPKHHHGIRHTRHCLYSAYVSATVQNCAFDWLSVPAGNPGTVWDASFSSAATEYVASVESDKLVSHSECQCVVYLSLTRIVCQCFL